ncbi:MAG: histidine kinase [Eubacteriales bacterium]
MIKWIANKIKSQFVNKIIAIIILSIIIPLIIIFIVLYLLYFRMVENAFVEESQGQVEYLADYMDTLIQNIDQSVTVFLSETSTGEYLSVTESRGFSDLQIRTDLVDLAYGNVLISNVYLLREINSVLNVEAAASQWQDATAEQIQESNWYVRFKEQQGFYVEYVEELHNSGKIIYSKSIYDFTTREFQGGVFVNIGTSSFKEVLEDALSEDEIGFLMDDKGTVIFSTGDMEEIDVDYMIEKMIEPDIEGYFFDDTHYYYYQNLNQSSLYLVKVLPKVLIKNEVRSTFVVGGMIAVISIVLGLFAVIWYTRRLVLPIMQMADVLKNADPENLQYIEVSPRQDEVSILQSSHNTMITNYNNLLNENYIALMEKKQAQLKALQFQINPHFVNNTLQMVGSKAIEQKVPEIYKYLKSFSNMFYYCIKNGQDTVTVKEEMAYLNDYILLQKARFPDRIEVKIRIDDRAYGNLIPKMSLQPILENCFVHGMPSKPNTVNRLKIMIAVVTFEDHCTIMIEDDGVGISEEKLEKIRKRLTDASNIEEYDYSGSIGIHNVNTRIKLLYGNEYGCTISSEQGTMVQINIPVKKDRL